MKETKSRKYESINVNKQTKLRVDEKYYQLKVKNNFKTFDDFVNYMLDVLEKK